jgi:exopolysaccharide/PEP-CTERM locus tyrosine autokinase
MGKIHDALKKSQHTVDSPPSELNEGAAKKMVVDPEVKFDERQDDTKNLGRRDPATENGMTFQLIDKDKTAISKKTVTQNFDKNLVTVLRPKSFETEIFKILRSNILFPADGKPPKSIMITSAQPGEGKSFVASNLAVSIAQNIDEHVLLLDCDIRNPTINKILGLGQVPGLSDYLSNGKPLNQLFIKTHIEKLTILTGGNSRENPSELLSSKEMFSLLDELKSRYTDRYLIIDSPPPQLTAETHAIAKHVDSILLVIEYGGPPKEVVADIVESIDKEKIIGAVLNKADINSLSYGYGRYRGYGKYMKYYRQS